MAGECPFVVTVASEKGGVGKTTLATNLAVYLKALREDLPVTICSFDNHFSVDNMFAIGGHKGLSVADLFSGVPMGELARLGEYGVQFLASDRSLTPPDRDTGHLARAISSSCLPGVLILDTRPILDYFTRSALGTADLVLVPVKDRASLVNVASLRASMLEVGGNPERVWLVPSLVDARLRLREGIGVQEFLRFSAQERGYQVLDASISKSPKVEGLATSFTSRIYPVLTHARSTVVHRQFRKLAAFVLQRYDLAEQPASLARTSGQAGAEVRAGRLRRVLTECPVCGRRAAGNDGQFFLDLRSRRRGFLHGTCLQGLLAAGAATTDLPAAGVLVFSTNEPDLTAAGLESTLHVFDEEGELMGAETLCGSDGNDLARLWQGSTGRLPEELYRDRLLVNLGGGPPADCLVGPGRTRFSALRRKALREIMGKDKG